MVVLVGHAYSVLYQIKNSKGDVVSSSENNEPLEIVPGNGQMFSRVEDRLLETKVGQNFSINLMPEEAFGAIDEEAVATVPVESLPKDLRFQGAEVSFESDEESYIGVVKWVQGDLAEVDFNHPLAGEAVTVDITLISVNATQ